MARQPATLILPVGSEVRAGMRPDARMAEAVRGLWLRRPDLSARGPAPHWLLPMALLVVGVVAFGLVFDTALTTAVIGLVLLPPFAGATVLRIVAFVEVLRRPSIAAPAVPAPAWPAMALPRYSILVPLYDEAAVLGRLVAGLAELDYPVDRLDVLIILEERDTATRQVAASLDLPRHMRIVVVPPGGPQTKPKALNYALSYATGDLIVVYDAEDRPERDQLRIAAAAFRRAGPALACLQARLNIYNPDESFFTRGIMAQTPLSDLLGFS